MTGYEFTGVSKCTNHKEMTIRMPAEIDLLSQTFTMRILMTYRMQKVTQ